MSETRLRRAQDFQRLYRRGRAERSDGLVVRSVANRLEVSRLAVVVSKKTAKSAPHRNRIRRQVKEVWRKAADRQAPGYDIIVQAVQDRDFTPAEIESALKSSGLLR